jgi:hypothetical protein
MSRSPFRAGPRGMRSRSARKGSRYSTFPGGPEFAATLARGPLDVAGHPCEALTGVRAQTIRVVGAGAVQDQGYRDGEPALQRLLGGLTEEIRSIGSRAQSSRVRRGPVTGTGPIQTRSCSGTSM